MSSFSTYLFATRLCHTLPAANGVVRCATGTPQRAGACSEALDGVSRHTCVMAIGADFKIYLLRQFCSNRVKFFYNTQETQTQKMMDQNFEIQIVIVENFFKFSKRRRAVPLRPMWTIMVAAKLHHCRVLVTKLRQNRSTLKLDRQTDTQTHKLG